MKPCDSAIKNEETNPRTVTETREKILKLLVEWVVTLSMSHWLIRHNFNERKHFATANAQTKYLEALISFNTKAMRTLPNWEFEETIVHELVHCLIWELAEAAKGNKNARTTVDEQTTSLIARALMKAKYFADGEVDHDRAVP